jgi:hypothetical protein
LFHSFVVSLLSPVFFSRFCILSFPFLKTPKKPPFFSHSIPYL